ncbi:pyridoxal phosphate-dependent aminotransferase [Streptomyces sp. NRRL S-920]|uniref:pyridoxal phosphate-dependent aminotransferase n=1 Tax=Streptomyces sp. NRRL S-920 TaxID=1463921 RepID=UPI0004C8A8AB|nr:pyridoxal phosphate-dependent aminotransferase [Streptomyces sp. NRRL S-920]
MEHRTARKLARVERSATMALADQARSLRQSGRQVVNLAGGDPHFGTPAHVLEAARDALDEGFTHYTSSRGLPELRKAVTDRLSRKLGVTRDPDREVIITPSAKHAVFASLMAVLDPGDEVLIPTPSWVSYVQMVRLAGGQPVPVRLCADDNFTLSRERLQAKLTPRTKAIVLNYPTNPTGRVASMPELRDIAEVVAAHDLVVISDEIYEDIVFGQTVHRSPAAFPECAERTLTVSGFSKSFAMTGWRLGYVSGPREFVNAVLKVQEHSVGEAGSFIQRGGVAALLGDDAPVRRMVEQYDRHRKWAHGMLNQVPGIECALPEGAFYLFPDISALGFSDSHTCAQWLIDKAGVVVTPGSAFGPGGEGHIRLSLAPPTATVEAGFNRLCDALSTFR